MMKTILAAIDFSPVTKRVVAEAMALAQAEQARVLLLNVTTPAALVADYAALEAVIEGADPRSGKKRAAAGRSAIQGDTLQIIGKPVEVILEQAGQCGADYIVMGSHGRTALFDLLVGGTAGGVIKGAGCPVMIVPAARGRSGYRQTRARRRKAVARLKRAARRETRPRRIRSGR